jgi:uncharacterized protein YjiS (DUF1127 family)
MSRPVLTTLPPDAVTLLNLPPLSRLLVQAGFALARWEMRRRTRNALQRLDPHLLHDIGLGPDDRATECARPFWQA